MRVNSAVRCGDADRAIISATIYKSDKNRKIRQTQISLEKYRIGILADIPKGAIAGGLIALLGVGILIGQGFQPESTNQIRIEKAVKQR